MVNKLLYIIHNRLDTRPSMATPEGAEQTEKKQGTPTKYREEYDELAYKYCLLGADDKDLARNFDVCERTINNWKEEFPSFLQSLKNGKEIADSEVAKSLYQRAKGYSHPDEKIFNDNGCPLVVPTEKHYPPDTGAAMAWLSNRQRHKWKARQSIESTIQAEVTAKDKYDTSRLSDDKLEQLELLLSECEVKDSENDNN